MANEITDAKEAALRVLLDRLQQIDQSMSSRGTFAGGIIMCQMNHLDSPVFEPEINLIKEVLGIKEEKVQESEAAEPKSPKQFQLDEL